MPLSERTAAVADLPHSSLLQAAPPWPPRSRSIACHLALHPSSGPSHLWRWVRRILCPRASATYYAGQSAAPPVQWRSAALIGHHHPKPRSPCSDADHGMQRTVLRSPSSDTTSLARCRIFPARPPAQTGGFIPMCSISPLRVAALLARVPPSLHAARPSSADLWHSRRA